jgi:hypothetical protein
LRTSEETNVEEVHIEEVYVEEVNVLKGHGGVPSGSRAA